MTVDLEVRCGFYHNTEEHFYAVKPVSTIGHALVSFYHGSLPEDNKEEFFMGAKQFVDFSKWAQNATSGKFNLSMVIKGS